MLTMLQGHVYWADLCAHLDREDLVADPRFATAEAFMANAEDVKAELRARLRAEDGRRMAHAPGHAEGPVGAAPEPR